MVDEPIVFDPTTHAQVMSLMGAERTRSLLLMLRSLVQTLAGLSATALVSQAGLASIHRLKSEAGLMGFIRLSDACAAFDGQDRGSHSPGAAIPDLRSAISSTLLVTNELIQPVEE